MNKDLHCSNVYHAFIPKIYISIIQTVDYVNSFKHVVLSHLNENLLYIDCVGIDY